MPREPYVTSPLCIVFRANADQIYLSQRNALVNTEYNKLLAAQKRSSVSKLNIGRVAKKVRAGAAAKPAKAAAKPAAAAPKAAAPKAAAKGAAKKK